MQLDHIALYTEDLERMRTFYERYFSAVSGRRYHNARTGLTTYFLTFPQGGRLEIMQRPDITSACRSAEQLGYAHLAVGLGSRDAVDQLTKSLAADGYVAVSGPRVTGDGYYESCVLDPDGNRIELVE